MIQPRQPSPPPSPPPEGASQLYGPRWTVAPAWAAYGRAARVIEPLLATLAEPAPWRSAPSTASMWAIGPHRGHRGPGARARHPPRSWVSCSTQTLRRHCLGTPRAPALLPTASAAALLGGALLSWPSHLRRPSPRLPWITGLLHVGPLQMPCSHASVLVGADFRLGAGAAAERRGPLPRAGRQLGFEVSGGLLGDEGRRRLSATRIRDPARRGQRDRCSSLLVTLPARGGIGVAARARALASPRPTCAPPSRTACPRRASTPATCAWATAPGLRQRTWALRRRSRVRPTRRSSKRTSLGSPATSTVRGGSSWFLRDPPRLSRFDSLPSWNPP